MGISSPLQSKLSTPNSTIRLLSTDFDGTLVNHDAQPPVSLALFETLAALQARGCLWAIILDVNCIISSRGWQNIASR